MKEKFLFCTHCSNLVGKIYDSGVPLICCGEEMVELEPNTVEASQEKHLPVVKLYDDIVCVDIGAAPPHPMEEVHYIQWVYLQTERGGQRKAFQPGDKPSVKFNLIDDKPVAVYAYCNLHGLWKTAL